MEKGEGQWRGSRAGWDDHRGLPCVYPSALGSDSDKPQQRHVSPGTGAPSVHSQAQRDLRPLGVPTVLDRVIQQAIAQVLTPLFEPHFSSHSYGFRYGKRAHQAVRAVEAASREG